MGNKPVRPPHEYQDTRRHSRGQVAVDSRGLFQNNARSFVRTSIQDLRRLTLANTAQARKRARQAEKRRQHNASLRSTMRTTMKKVVKLIEAGDKQGATDAYKEAVPVIDSATGKGLVHRNKAARHKSRLNAHIKAMA